jgi:WD40 repeat protein
LTFESFSVPASDPGNEKPDACKVSRTIGFLACRHWRRDAQGLVVWRVLGGAFRFEREAGRFRTNSAVRMASGILAASDKGLISLGDKDERVLGALPADWRIVASAGETLVAASPDSSQVQAFRFENGAAIALPPVPGNGTVLDAAGRSMVVLRAEAVARVGHDGSALWSARVAGARAVAFAQGGREVVVATGRDAYVLDGESGRILRSYPAPAGAEAPIALAPDGAAIAYGQANGSVSILDLTSGASTPIETSGATALAWSPDRKALFVGRADGTVSAWAGGRSLWSAPSPLERAFEASAWPGQPAKGVVHEISVSPDGRRIAVVRQDLPAAILYDARDGRRLTQLTPPWAFGVPAHVSFTKEGETITAWAVHAMTRGKPSYVTVHQLPGDFAQALARGKQHLARLRQVWPVDAPPSGSERRP